MSRSYMKFIFNMSLQHPRSSSNRKGGGKLFKGSIASNSIYLKTLSKTGRLESV
jgi:hypothetical protein